MGKFSRKCGSLSMLITQEDLILSAEKELKETWGKFEEIRNHNQIKVLKAFQTVGIQNVHYLRYRRAYP